MCGGKKKNECAKKTDSKTKSSSSKETCPPKPCEPKRPLCQANDSLTTVCAKKAKKCPRPSTPRQCTSVPKKPVKPDCINSVPVKIKVYCPKRPKSSKDLGKCSLTNPCCLSDRIRCYLGIPRKTCKPTAEKACSQSDLCPKEPKEPKCCQPKCQRVGACCPKVVCKKKSCEYVKGKGLCKNTQIQCEYPCTKKRVSTTGSQCPPPCERCKSVCKGPRILIWARGMLKSKSSCRRSKPRSCKRSKCSKPRSKKSKPCKRSKPPRPKKCTDRPMCCCSTNVDKCGKQKISKVCKCKKLQRKGSKCPGS